MVAARSATTIRGALLTGGCREKAEAPATNATNASIDTARIILTSGPRDFLKLRLGFAIKKNRVGY